VEVLVVGAGAAGGYLGAQLVTAGRDVSFLVRQSSFERLTAHGLRIHGKFGTSALPVRAVTASQLTGSYDVVVLAVRSEVVESAVEDFRGVVTPDTRILPLVNGMAHLSVLTAAFGEQAVLGAAVRLATSMLADGIIDEVAPGVDLEVGQLDGGTSDIFDAVVQRGQRRGAGALGHGGGDVGEVRLYQRDRRADLPGGERHRCRGSNDGRPRIGQTRGR
jgi:2-dehydropantoate 2-reductase